MSETWSRRVKRRAVSAGCCEESWSVPGADCCCCCSEDAVAASWTADPSAVSPTCSAKAAAACTPCATRHACWSALRCRALVLRASGDSFALRVAVCCCAVSFASGLRARSLARRSSFQSGANASCGASGTAAASWANMASTRARPAGPTNSICGLRAGETHTDAARSKLTCKDVVRNHSRVVDLSLSLSLSRRLWHPS